MRTKTQKIRLALEEALAIDRRDNDEPSMYTAQLEEALAALSRLEQHWTPIADQVPDGNVLLCGSAWDDPNSGEWWYRCGYYATGVLYADDEFDPWTGYQPTHFATIPAGPSSKK